MRQITTMPKDSMRARRGLTAKRLKRLSVLSTACALLALINPGIFFSPAVILTVVLTANIISYAALRRQVDQKLVVDLGRRGFNVISLDGTGPRGEERFTALLNEKKVNGEVRHDSQGQRSIWANISRE